MTANKRLADALRELAGRVEGGEFGDLGDEMSWDEQRFGMTMDDMLVELEGA